MSDIESTAYAAFHSHVFLGEGHEASERGPGRSSGCAAR